MHPELDAVVYRRHLESFWGFYAPFETTLAALHWAEHGIDLTERCKTPLLRADLISLGVDDPDTLPRCNRLPSLPGITAAFGSLYVLEGASLGGQIISRHVATQLGYTATHGASYFNGYGAQTGAMWMAFRRAIDACGTEEVARAEMIAGALATFVEVREWCTRSPAG
jgi:heme oxygenase